MSTAVDARRTSSRIDMFCYTRWHESCFYIDILPGTRIHFAKRTSILFFSRRGTCQRIFTVTGTCRGTCKRLTHFSKSICHCSGKAPLSFHVPMQRRCFFTIGCLNLRCAFIVFDHRLSKMKRTFHTTRYSFPHRV